MWTSVECAVSVCVNEKLFDLLQVFFVCRKGTFSWFWWRWFTWSTSRQAGRRFCGTECVLGCVSVVVGGDRVRLLMAGEDVTDGWERFRDHPQFGASFAA